MTILGNGHGFCLQAVLYVLLLVILRAYILFIFFGCFGIEIALQIDNFKHFT